MGVCARAAAEGRRARGITLVELVMVLVLLAVLGSVAAPRFFARRDLDRRFYSEDVLAALRHAQRRAVATGCPVELRFTGADFALRQRSGCQTGAFSAPVPDPSDGAATYTGQAPAGTALVSSQNPIVFDALGRALAGGAPSDVTLTVGGRLLLLSGETGLAWDPAL